MGSEEPDTKSLLDLGSGVGDPVDDIGETASEEDKTEIQDLSNEDNQKAALQKVRQAVREFGEEEGVTVSELEEVTGLTRPTVRKHLKTLRRLREVYRRKRSKQIYLYYPNGKPLHSFGKKRIENGDNILDVQLAEGPNDELHYHITEKKSSLLEGESTEGAIIFPRSSLDEFFEKLQEFEKEVDE